MDTKNVKDIKITNNSTQKVLTVNEILWQKRSLGPGPKKLIGGNSEAGFYGECPASELITGDELARRIGLTRGLSQFSNEPWLKFSYMGKIEFVAKKPFRYAISWDNINAVNAVFGNRTIKIGEHNYKIRLLKGKTEGKQSDSSSCNGNICKGSEWNKLMLPIHVNAPSNWKYPKNVNSPTENWNGGYTDADLVTYNKGNGSISWCQDIGIGGTYRLARGGDSVSPSNGFSSSWGNKCYGWRPVLELVD